MKEPLVHISTYIHSTMTLFYRLKLQISEYLYLLDGRVVFVPACVRFVTLLLYKWLVHNT